MKNPVMEIHVARNGQPLGQFSVEEVNRKLATGAFSPTDLGWHEGAAGWAPLSTIAGVKAPGVASPAMPTSPPHALPQTPSAAPTQPAPNVGGADPPQPIQTCKGMIITSWILLGFTALLSIVPVIGFAAWILAFIVIPVTFILAIVILTRGRKTQGILLLVASVAVLPVFILVASLTSTLILGAAVSEREKMQEKQIVANLYALSEAKEKWIAQTRVTDGAQVTVAGLALYLDGREIKSIVGETYDPKPVGQEPTATLPATKSLASHQRGEAFTADGSSIEAEASPPSVDLETDDEAPSPSASPRVL